jgi:hypothetical protein
MGGSHPPKPTPCISALAIGNSANQCCCPEERQHSRGQPQANPRELRLTTRERADGRRLALADAEQDAFDDVLDWLPKSAAVGA